MELELTLFASLRERAGCATLALTGLPDELDVAGLKRELARRHPELGDLAHVAGVVGTEYVSDDTPLKSGDEVAFLPPVSGGSPATDEELEQGVFELSSEPLDVPGIARRVEHRSCGALTTFSGTARDWNRGKRVVRLEYEAFDKMTGPEMQRIFERCLAKHAPDEASSQGSPRTLRMLVVHRIGAVQILEPAVVIAVASPHRDASFRAARFLIDELKKTLPIWKKEVYEDGEHWIGDRS